MSGSQVADGIYRLGTKWVNFYVIDDGGSLTVLDTGFKGYASQVLPFLDDIGKSPSDVKAILISHYHTDHLGAAQAIADATGASVFVNALELEITLGKQEPTVPDFFPLMEHPVIQEYIQHAQENDGLMFSSVAEADTYADGDTLDVPGGLRVIHTPGHTLGHSSFYLEGKKVLFSADALPTTDVTRFEGPPTLMPEPLNTDQAAAVASLTKLRELDAALILPGHGEPWTEEPLRRSIWLSNRPRISPAPEITRLGEPALVGAF